MNYFITKPVDVKKLDSILAEISNSKSSGDGNGDGDSSSSSNNNNL